MHHTAGVQTGTLAAAAGGITTVIDMPLNSKPATTTPALLKNKTAVVWVGHPAITASLAPKCRAGHLGDTNVHVCPHLCRAGPSVKANWPKPCWLPYLAVCAPPAVPAVQEKVLVDTGFWAGLVPENAHQPAVLRGMIKAGTLGFKAFMSPSGAGWG